MAKVTIIGATGQVGSYVAHAVSQFPHVREMCLFGRPGNEQFLDGLAHDMMDSFAARGTNTSVTFSTDAKDLRGSDIIVLTSGIPRKADQTRLDLALENARIVKYYAEMIGRMAPEAILLVVTNPVDIMTTVALKYSRLMPNRVFGLGTHLDSMRLKACLAEFFNVHVSEVHTRIVGEHGNSMVPMWSATTVGGISIDNLMDAGSIDREGLLDRVKNSGSYIIKSKGATVYGPGDAVASLIRTIVEDDNRCPQILPSDAEPGLWPGNSPGFDAPESMPCRVFQCACERSPHENCWRTRKLDGPHVVRDNGRRYLD